tara:strand:+ start:799 stop:1023 length:225 start_codon:yes stop_codon:yes gene_type:complete
MPGHYTEKTTNSPKHKPGGPNSQFTKSGASKRAQTIDPFNSKSTESGKVNDERYNPWGKGSKKNPTNSSQTTGP